MTTDQIEKRIELKAPVSRVWRALTDYREFGEWFRVKLEGPFVVGQVSRGHILHPGYEHVKWEVVVQKIEPEKIFSFAGILTPLILTRIIRRRRRRSWSSGWRRRRPEHCFCSRSRASINCRAIAETKRSGRMTAVGQRK